MEQQNKLKIFSDLAELSKAAADFILATANHAVEERGRFTIVLSGGTTPEKLYGLLALPPYSNNMPWSKTHVCWGDERCVPLTDGRNNAHRAKVILLDKVAIPTENIHRIPVNLPPKQAAETYERELKTIWKESLPKFDLILLGLGNDGHTASLFPGTTELQENSSLIKEVYLPEQNMHRITMTAPLINTAQHVLFMVSGREKCNILYKVLADSTTEQNRLPAQLIKPLHGDLLWFVDAQAAACL